MYITTIIFIITDVASIQDFSLNSNIFRKSLCWCLHRYQIFGHLDRWSRASGPWHFYLPSHHFRWKPRSRFYSTNLCCCCLGRGHTPSGKYQSFAVYIYYSRTWWLFVTSIAIKGHPNIARIFYFKFSVFLKY